MNAEANKNIFLRYDYHSHTSVKKTSISDASFHKGQNDDGLYFPLMKLDRRLK